MPAVMSPWPRRRSARAGRAAARSRRDATRGADGVVVAAPDGALYEGVLYVRGRYPVGSGDAFLARLVSPPARGAGWGEALRLALGAATANAELPGAGRLDPSRAESLAEQATVRLI